MNIPELARHEFLAAGPVERAYADLMNITSRKVEVHSRSFAPIMLVAFWIPTPEKHHIFIDERLRQDPHEAVHEITHAILAEEGYYRLAGDLNTYVSGTLSNELQHPEIFRRMQAYGLDMASYWESWKPKLEEMAAEIVNHSHCCSIFDDFPQLFTWFFFPQASKVFLERVCEFNSSLHDAAKSAFHEAERIGLASVESHLRYLGVFKDHWYRYCELHLPKDQASQTLLTKIELSAPERISDHPRFFSDDEIIVFLRKKGYAH